MIEVNQLSKKYKLSKKQQKEMGTNADEVTPVNDISFQCLPGRVFSLLGPNGAGKTTTLRMISTILTPTSGNIKICGVDTVKNGAEARRKIGFLTGSTGLYERLTVDEMIKFFADLNDVTENDFKNRKQRYYDMLDMHEFSKKKTGELSTGMKQKVNIVRTMIHDPEVVVFDEPTSGLDVISAENIIRLINHCKDEAKTVIFSSHIMTEVDLLCDDLAIINKGKIIYKGEMKDFRENMQAANLTAEFIRLIDENKTPAHV